MLDEKTMETKREESYIIGSIGIPFIYNNSQRLFCNYNPSRVHPTNNPNTQDNDRSNAPKDPNPYKSSLASCIEMCFGFFELTV